MVNAALAVICRVWQGGRMARSPQNSNAGGGAAIAVGAIAGPVIGLYAGQPSIGFLVGIATGSAIAVLLWLSRR